MGKRMRSDLPKVLHPVEGRPMIAHCVERARRAGIDEVVVVVGYGADQVAEALAGHGVELAVQAEQLGTGHAVIQAQPFLDGFDGNIIVLYGDMPLLTAGTIRAVVDRRDELDSAAAILTIELDNPPDFGRIVRDAEGRVERVVEVRDATPEQLAIREVNVGPSCFDGPCLLDALGRLKADNAQGEYYLTDVVGILAGEGRRVETVATGDLVETLGINDSFHLDFARKLRHIRHAESMYAEVDAAYRRVLARRGGG